MSKLYKNCYTPASLKVDGAAAFAKNIKQNSRFGAHDAVKWGMLKQVGNEYYLTPKGANVFEASANQCVVGNKQGLFRLKEKGMRQLFQQQEDGINRIISYSTEDFNKEISNLVNTNTFKMFTEEGKSLVRKQLASNPDIVFCNFSENNIQEFTSIVNNRALNHKFIYCYDESHTNLVSPSFMYNKQGYRLIFDSVGYSGNHQPRIVDLEDGTRVEATGLVNLQIEALRTLNKNVVIGSEQRQFSLSGCQMFTINDYETLQAGGSQLYQKIIASSEKNHNNVYVFQKYPAKMMKLAQSLSALQGDPRGKELIGDKLTLFKAINNHTKNINGKKQNVFAEKLQDAWIKKLTNVEEEGKVPEVALEDVAYMLPQPHGDQHVAETLLNELLMSEADIDAWLNDGVHIGRRIIENKTQLGGRVVEKTILADGTIEIAV